MGSKESKQERLEQLSALLVPFCKDHLTEELTIYVNRLVDMLAKSRKYDVTKGKVEILGTAVVCVIARLNFLFDKTRKNYISMEKICNYFGTKKTTVATRANEIEAMCNIRIGHEGLCNDELSDELTFIQLPNGMVITKAMAKRKGLIK